MCVCPPGLADPFLQSTWQGPCASSCCALSSLLREGCVQDIAGISSACPGSAVPDLSTCREGSLWTLRQSWALWKPRLSVGKTISSETGEKFPAAGAGKSKVNIKSISCSNVLEAEEGLLTIGDIKSPNFQEKSSPPTAGMVVRQPDLALLCSWPLLFPLSFTVSLSKYTGAPGEGVQPGFLQHGAALSCCGSKHSVSGGWREGWCSVLFSWCSLGVLLSPAPTAHRRQTNTSVL